MLADLLEKALNTVIRMDPDTLARLDPLKSKNLAVEFQLLTEHRFLFGFTETRVSVSSEDHDTLADATVKGGPAGFLRGVLNPTDRSIFTDGGLQVEGDIHVVQACADLVVAFDPDWQEKVSPILGDVATYRLEQVLSHFQKWAADAHNKARADSGDYLKEEARILAPGPRVQKFSDDVDHLVADLDRIVARIDRLEREISGH